jgi:hypothetical protein
MTALIGSQAGEEPEQVLRPEGFQGMSAERIPVLWDNGDVSFASADERGILRLRAGRRRTTEQELALLSGAAKLPSLALPVVHSPALGVVEAEALFEELARLNKQPV